MSCGNPHNTSVHGYLAYCHDTHPLVQLWYSAWLNPGMVRAWRHLAHRVVGPGRTPERTRGQGWGSAQPRTPHTQARGAPPGTLMQPPQRARARAVGSVTGPHTCSPRGHSQWVAGHTPTPVPTARGQRASAARAEGGQPGEGVRLTRDASHNSGRHPPRGFPLPPPPRRTTPARKGARRGAGAGCPRPHRPHPGHTGRGTLAARSRGRAAGGGTAPDTRHPSKW